MNLFMSKTDFYKIAIKFLLICITGLAVNYANSLLVSQDMLTNFLTDKGYKTSDISYLLNKIEQNKWAQYGILTLILSLKIFFAWFCITIVIFFNDKKNPGFTLLNAIIVAQLIWLIQPLIQLFWFGNIQTQYSLVDIQNFPSFSLNDLLNQQSTIVVSFSKIFSLISVYELLYCLLIAYGLYIRLEDKFMTYLWLVLTGYGIGSLILEILLSFIQISYS